MNFNEFYFKESKSDLGNAFEESIVSGLRKEEIKNLSIKSATQKIIYSDAFKKEGIEVPADVEYLGNQVFDVSNNYKNISGEIIRKSKSKTDILVNKENRISIKAGPQSQLMNAGKIEAIGVFNAIIKNKELEYSKEIMEIIERIQTNIEKKFMGGGETFLGTQEQIETEAEKIKVYFETDLEKLYNDPIFKVDFIKESLSGKFKFIETKPIANKVLGFSLDGKIVKIHDIDDINFINEVLKNTKLGISFKSDSQKIGGKKTGKRFGRSVFRLWWQNPNFRTSGKNQESFQTDNFDNFILKEYKQLHNDLLKEDLKEIFNKIKDFFFRIFNKLKENLKNGIQYFLEFIGLIPEINFNNEISFY